MIGDSRTGLPSRAKVCAISWTSFWSSLPAGPTAIRKRRRPQHIIKRAGGDAEQENPRGEDQQRIVLSLPARAGWGRIVVLV